MTTVLLLGGPGHGREVSVDDGNRVLYQEVVRGNIFDPEAPVPANTTVYTTIYKPTPIAIPIERAGWTTVGKPFGEYLKNEEDQYHWSRRSPWLGGDDYETRIEQACDWANLVVMQHLGPKSDWPWALYRRGELSLEEKIDIDDALQRIDDLLDAKA